MTSKKSCIQLTIPEVLKIWIFYYRLFPPHVLSNVQKNSFYAGCVMLLCRFYPPHPKSGPLLLIQGYVSLRNKENKLVFRDNLSGDLLDLIVSSGTKMWFSDFGAQQLSSRFQGDAELSLSSFCDVD